MDGNTIYQTIAVGLTGGLNMLGHDVALGTIGSDLRLEVYKDGILIKYNASDGEITTLALMNTDKGLNLDMKDHGDLSSMMGTKYAYIIKNTAAKNVTLIGADGNDSLTGGTGDDILVGGDGADRLYGDDGKDVFVLRASQIGTTTSYTRIRDFEDGEDKLDVSQRGTEMVRKIAFGDHTVL